MSSIYRLLSGVLLTLVFASCNSGVTAPDATGTVTEVDANSFDSSVITFATDYASSGLVTFAGLDESTTTKVNSDLTLLGTEANLKYLDGRLYILHAGGIFNSISTDNIELVDFDEATSAFSVTGQFSTGNGTNPQDVVIRGTANDDSFGQRAFIGLYNPESDSENVDTDGNPADVIEMDLASGEITHRYAFFDYLNDDGERLGRAIKILNHNNDVYVLLQDITSDDDDIANAPAVLGIIDASTHTVSNGFMLSGYNPSSMVLSDDATKLFVGHVNDYSAFSDFGGLEVVNIDSQATELFVTDANFGGYLEKMTSCNGQVYATIGLFDFSDFTFASKIISFPQTITSVDDISEFLPFGDDIRSITCDDTKLWVGFRTISTTEGQSDPTLRVYDTETGLQIGSDITTVAPITSMAVVE